MKKYTHPSTRAVVLVASALLCSVPGLLQAQDSPSATATELDEAAEHQEGGKAAAAIGAKFTEFAGSGENATALVTGLRNGTAITLTTTVDGAAVTTEFQPATGKLGYGNAYISLALAQKSLAQAGITQPTPEQLIAALNGGTVTGADGTAVTLAGVLTLRAAGDGWGNIAKTLGVKLGPIMRDMHAVNERVEHPERPEVADGAEHARSDVAKVAKPERAERLERPERPVRAAEAPVTARPEGAGRPVWAGSQAAVARPMLPPVQPVRPGRH
jgi:hypothetical protein